MDRAKEFYEKNGFVYTELTLGSTGTVAVIFITSETYDEWKV